MRRSTMAIAAATCSGLLAIGLVAAPAASAYPPGKQQKTEVNKSQVRQDGRFKAVVVNAQPGCRVTFTVVNANGKVVDSRTGKVGKKGRAQREFSPAPSRPGTYTVISEIRGSGCTPAESAATITVRQR